MKEALELPVSENKCETDDVDEESIVAVIVSVCTVVIEGKIVSVITDEPNKEFDGNAVFERLLLLLAETDTLCDERGVTLTDGVI